MIRTEALPEMVAAWSALARDAASSLAIQIDVADWGGTRTQSDTATIIQYRTQDYALYAAAEKKAGRVPLAIDVWRRIAPYGSSYHNYGAARDAKIVSKPAGMTSDAAISKLRGIASRNGLRVISNDPLHFELPITLEEARRRWDAFKNPKPAAPPVRIVSDDDNDVTGGDIASSDDSASDATGGGSTTTFGGGSRPGGALLGALLAFVAVGGAYVLYRRLTS